jgi:hypothetical protein
MELTASCGKDAIINWGGPGPNWQGNQIVLIVCHKNCITKSIVFHLRRVPICNNNG